MVRTHILGALASVAGVALAGCGGGVQPTLAMPQQAAQSQQAAQAQAGRSSSTHFTLPEDFARIRSLEHPAHSWMSPDAKGKSLVYVLEGTCGCVLVYPQKVRNPEPIGQIAELQGPDWLGIGPDGMLWISQSANDSIVGYPHGSITPAVTLSDPCGCFPENIAVDDAGDVYVANTGGTGLGASVAVYQNGSTSPTQTLGDPSVTGMIGVAVDQKHDVFVSAVNTTNQRIIGEFVAGSSGYTFKTIVPAQNPTALYLGIKLDPQGNLVVSSQGPLSVVVYSPPNWTQTATFGGTAGATDVAFTKTSKQLYGAYLNNRAVVEWAYPSTKQVNELISGLYTPSSVVADPRPADAP